MIYLETEAKDRADELIRGTPEVFIEEGPLTLLVLAQVD